MITREELEKRENELLAPYAAKSSDYGGRRFPEGEHPFRTAFQRDRDRIIHSTAFRRLEYKTQVFVNHEGDYYRTRLTHTMEAAQIARTLARSMNLNEDLAEVLALSHDVGHTPFGHSGEDALKEAMREHGEDFEHNVQGLRVVDILERRYPDFRGLNLTWITRESMRKHSVKPNHPVEAEYKPEWSPLFECQIVDIADSIAYDAHDIDDSIKAGLLDAADLDAVVLWREAIEIAKSKKTLEGDILIKQAVRTLINMEVTDLIENSEAQIRRAGVDGLNGVRQAKDRMISFSKSMERNKAELQSFLKKHVYRHYRVIRMAEKARKFIRELYVAYVGNKEQLPPQFQTWADEVGLHRAVGDYIAGMTDRYAQDEYKKLFYPFERV